MRIETYIPSYKRARSLTTKKFMPWATLAVGEDEAEEYREIWGDPIMVLPEKVNGNIARVRNFILDNATCDQVLMCDDDYAEIGYFQAGKEHPLRNQHLLDFITNGFTMAKEMGVGLWGLQAQKDPKFYREYSPFSLLSIILAPFHGVIRSELRYDEGLPLKDDYDFFIQSCRKFHKCLRFNKYWYLVGHIDVPGGCSAYRNFKREIAQNQKLQKKWGRRIVRFHSTRRKQSLNPVIKIPFKGI